LPARFDKPFDKLRRGLRVLGSMVLPDSVYGFSRCAEKPHTIEK
jgi:hypothetical protein